MQIRPTAFTIGLIIHFSIALFCVYTEFGIDSLLHFPFDYLFYKPKNYCSIFFERKHYGKFLRRETYECILFSVWFLDTFRKRERSVYHFDYSFLCKDFFLYIFFLFDFSFWILFLPSVYKNVRAGLKNVHTELL